MPTFTAADFPIPGKTQAQVQAALAGVNQGAIFSAMTAKVTLQEAGVREKIKGISVQKHPSKKFRERLSKHCTKAGKIAKVFVDGTLVEISTTDRTGQALKTSADLDALKAQIVMRKAKSEISRLLLAALNIKSTLPLPL